MEDYNYTTEAIDKYYSGTDQWKVISNHNINPEDAESVLGQIQGVDVVKSANGKVLSYNFQANENVASSVEESINSNVQPNIKSFDVPATTAVDAAGKMTFTSGMAQAGKFVFTEVAPAIAAAGAGITLGKTIDKLLYSANPDFWDEHGMSALNPDEWNNITSNDTAGGRLFNMVFGLNPDHKTQAYMDQNALAYMALYMQNKGVFNESETKISKPEDESGRFDFMPESLKTFDCAVSKTGGFWNISKTDNNAISALLITTDDYGVVFKVGNKAFIQWEISVSASRFNNIEECYAYAKTYNGSNGAITINGTHTYKGKTKYVNYGGGLSGWNASSIDYLPSDIINHININANNVDKYANKIYDYLVGGALEQIFSIDGIGTQENAKTPDLSNATTVQEALDALKEQYPELFQNAVSQDVVQPDGSTVTYTYVPIAVPELDPEGNPISSPELDPEGNPIGSTQAFPQIDPATAPEPLLNLITTLLQKDPPVNPPDTGSGSAPAVVPASGSASALYAIYNPTLAQINAFGAWLWSDNFVDQIKKLFNDPMQAIIGLHKVYATPATSGAQTIKVGYLDSGVSANVVSSQYTTIDCGTVTLSEYFHNVFDYSPYTQINLYLPFIGIVSLDNADVMRASIHIVYHVDVLSGACLAEVKVTRDGAGGTLYQYTGNASVTLPISSGSYMGIVSSIASIAGGIAGTIASGGAALPMIASAAGSALNARAKVEHSGSFSGNAGAMGGKIPYLIISRPQVALASNFQKYIGYPANYTTKLSSCSGFVKVLECHIENVNATNSELTEIETLLKEGVLV